MHYDYTADFETTTDENDCRVWAFAAATIEKDPKTVWGNSIDSFFDFLNETPGNFKVYFHNLKFDGEFIIYYLLKHNFTWIDSKEDIGEFTFSTLITGNGLFYQITIYLGKEKKKFKKITIQDSLKLLNFSVDQIAKDFKLPIKKLSIDYHRVRKIGHNLTKQEIDYVKNDVEIMARALYILRQQNLKKMTIGSNALNFYKSLNSHFLRDFPVMSIEIDNDIRKSYRGGWTYLNPDYAGKMVGAGTVIDKNSMYPSQMYYQPLPVGHPCYYDGEYQNDFEYPLYIQSLSCSFKLKQNKLPSIQIKTNPYFKVNEWLTSSGDEIVNLNLTSVDLKLFLENYDVFDLSYHHGWKFRAATGLFKEYIDYWMNLKIISKKEGNNANYLISKLMLNSLYGKFGTNPRSLTKEPYLLDDVVHYRLNPEETKDPIYLPIATFITSYARSDIIQTAQKIVDYSIDKYNQNLFIYSDTDSLHTLLSADELYKIKDLELDHYKLGAWDCESEFSRAKFLRQKCYMEEIGEEISVHIAGLPRKLGKFMDFDHFYNGFSVSELGKEKIAGNEKLMYNHVKGGVILKETDFTIKG